MTLQVPKVIPHDWNRLRVIIDKLKHLSLGTNSSPTFTGITLTGLTASRLIATNASKTFVSLASPLIVAEGGTGLATITDGGLLLGSGTGSITPLARATNGQLPIGSTGADPVLAAITGTSNQITVTNAAGSITLSLPQDYHTGATPTLAGLTLTNAVVIGSDSVVFQPNTDSTTFLQVLDADGGTPIFNVDSTNERVGIGTATPSTDFHVVNEDSGFQEMFKLENTNTQILNGATRLTMQHKNSKFIINAYSPGAVGILTDSVGFFAQAGSNKFIVGHTGTSAGNDIYFFSNNQWATPQLVLAQTGNFGFGAEIAPETLTEWTSTVPYLTLHNSTPEDTDGGRESRLIFKGEQSGGEETTLARIEVGHDGSADDEKGYFDIFINDGDDGDSPTKIMRVNSDGITLSTISTVAAGLNVLRVTGLQTDGTAMTGTLRGAYIDVSNGSTAATGTIRGMELKARTEAPGDAGNDVAVLEGLSISADSKGHSVTTMRAAEFILDGSTGGTITEAVGLRIANNLQADKATISYGLQIYRDSFDYTADIQLSDGSVINKSGQWGIGTAIPSRKLTVIENDIDAIFIRDNSGTDASTLGLGINTTIGYTWIQSKSDSAGTTQPLAFYIGITKNMELATDGGIFMYDLKSGATQAAAGAAANELWVTSGHASQEDNTIMIGI